MLMLATMAEAAHVLHPDWHQRSSRCLQSSKAKAQQACSRWAWPCWRVGAQILCSIFSSTGREPAARAAGASREAGHGSWHDTLCVQGPKIEASSGSSCSSSVCSEVGLLKDGAALMLGSHQPRRPAKQAKGQAQGAQQARSQRSGSGAPRKDSGRSSWWTSRWCQPVLLTPVRHVVLSGLSVLPAL